MPNRKVAVTAMPLKAFGRPDTSSDVEATLPVGEYPIGETRVVGASTFVAVGSALIPDGDAWLCIRSGAFEYGNIVMRGVPPAPRASFADDALAVAERELSATLQAFVGWNYSLNDPRYPSAIGDAKLPTSPPNVNNCCTFVEALVAGTFARVHAATFKWNVVRHSQMMITSEDDHYSPITALLEAGAGVPPPADALTPPSPWTVFQGWKTQWGGGHTFIVVDHHVASDKVLILESNCTAELNGVGWRGGGRLSDALAPPAAWWTLPQVWTWQRLVASKPLRHRCVLRVKDRSLSGVIA